MRTPVLLLSLTGCIPELPVLADPCGAFPDPGLYELTVEAGNQGKRRPLIWVPPGQGPRDLVFMLHGAGQTPRDMEQVSGWNRLADQEGFAVIYPGGIGLLGKIWNASDDNPYTDTDDVAFLDATAALATERLCGARILAAGFSNGGSMVHRWGCESEWPDAIVPTEGGYLLNSCPAAPIATRIYHGTGDTTAPYDGDVREGVVIPSIAELTEIKLAQNACTTEAPTVAVKGTASCASYPCETPLTVCTLDGWNHRYPGGTNVEGVAFDATEESWAWFQELPVDD